MKRRSLILAALLAAATLLAGCSKQETARPAASQEQSVATATAAAEVAEQVAEAAQAAEKAAAEAATAVAEAPVAETPAPTASPVQAGSSPAPATPAPAAKVYAIGDTGPRGGIVFAASGGKYKEITKPENADVGIGAPPAGWKWSTMPELMQAYDALHTKFDYGDYWYFSNPQIGFGRAGTDYSRDHAMLSPAQTEYDRIRALFPDVQFILAAGGGSNDHNFIRFTDGKIILGDIYFSEPSDFWDADTFEMVVRALYVRDF